MKKLISVPAKRPRAQIVKTHTSAAKMLSLTPRTLRNYRAEGAPGFLPDGRVDLALLRPWIESKLLERDGSLDLKERKTLEEVRKLRLANDRLDGRLVERAWVLERHQLASGAMNAFRSKSEAEHPLRFAAANGDVALCRTIIRGIWDEIFATLQSEMGKHFQDAS
jgi:hypothetical protein